MYIAPVRSRGGSLVSNTSSFAAPLGGRCVGDVPGLATRLRALGLPTLRAEHLGWLRSTARGRAAATPHHAQGE